jgi:hypothetical protein
MATVYKSLTSNDIFTDTTKTTEGLFTGGTGTMSSFFTGALSASNEAYYVEVADKVDTDTSAVTYFDLSFGNVYATGSDLSAGLNSSNRETEAVYKQMANIVLDDPYAKFVFSDVSGSSVTEFTEESIYVLAVKTDKMKDRIHTKWTMVLSGSDSNRTGSKLTLTNYTGSKYPSIAGDYYKVVSGSTGTPYNPGTTNITTYGHFYPNLGLIVLNATNMSSSLPGGGKVLSTSGSSLGDGASSGFAVDTRTTGIADMPMKFFNCLESGSLIMRNEQDLNQTTYYCRLFHNEFNFSSNPSFITSGSTLGDIIETMVGDPTVYVSGIGLYNQYDEMIAVAKLNTPQKKNFNKEITIAAKLDG